MVTAEHAQLTLGTAASNHFLQIRYEINKKICFMPTRALQWSGNPHGNGYGVEMDGNGAQFVNILWIGLDLGQTVDLKRVKTLVLKMWSTFVHL